MAHFFPSTFSQSVVCVSLNPRASTMPSAPCRLSVFILSRWYHACRGQTWSPRASMAHFFPSTFSQSVVCVSLNPRASTIPSAPCRLSVFILSRWYHACRGQTWSPRASTTQCVPCLFSQSFVCVSLNPRASTIPSVPCRFSVFIPSRWYHASRGRTWHPRASTTQSLPCLFRQSLLCVSRSNLWHVGSVCSSHLGGTTHLVDERGTLEQAWPNLCHVFSVKVFFVFLLTLERVRSHLCHFSSVRVLCVSLNFPASRIRSVLWLSTVFLLASEKACRHRTSTIQSLLCLLSVLFFDRKCMLTLDDLSWAGDAISHSPLNNFIGSLRSRDHKRGISISSSVHACCFWWTAMR